ncbi:MAG: hypothetical protein JW900_04260 [Anaerolineae bacterium]|nr:hypothetical protein [Anaerolineae bacterium]
MTNDTLLPRDAIRQFLANELAGSALLRSFMTYRHWRVPAGFGEDGPWFRVIRMESIVNVNPFTALAIHYKQHQLPMLLRWAKAVELELALHDPAMADQLFALLRDFAHYQIVLRQVGEGYQMVLAPDDQGRRLAAVFTADDTLDAFMAWAAPQFDFQPLILTLGGRDLFAQLRNAPVDGVVFDCKGPVPPRAFARELAEHILGIDRQGHTTT